MPTEHCPQCTPEKRCGNYHLYVIELDRKVLESNKFLGQNPHIAVPEDAQECFYVGFTKHKCECRFMQHKRHAQGLNHYCCECDAEPEIVRFHRAGGKTKGNWFAGKFGIWLRPDIYASKNHIAYEDEAKEAEEELADELRGGDNAVWQN